MFIYRILKIILLSLQAVQQFKNGRKRKANRALNPKRSEIFSVKSNCGTASLRDKKGKSSKMISKLSMLAVLFISIVFISLTLVPVIIAQQIEVKVNAPEYVEEGEIFIATIDVDGVTDLNSAQFDLTFNPTVVKVSSVKKGKINGEDIPIYMWSFVDTDTVGVVIMLLMGEGVSGSGYLAKISFEVNGEEGDESALGIANGLLGDNIGVVTLFSIDEKFKDEFNDEEISDELKEIFKDTGYPLEDPTVKVIQKDERWKIIDEREIYVVKVENNVLKIKDTGEISANWTDAEIRVGVEEEKLPPMPSPTPTPTAGPDLTPTSTPKPSGFKAIFAIVVMLVIAYILLRRW